MNELKSRVTIDQAQGAPGQQKRPIRGPVSSKDDKASPKHEPVSTDMVLRKVDCYMQEIQHLLLNVTANTDRLLGRNTHAESPDRGYT